MSDGEMEVTGRTVEDATRKAEDELGLSREEFEMEIVHEGRTGVLGLGGEDAVIRVRPLAPPESAGSAAIGTVGEEIVSKLLELMGLEGDVKYEDDGSSAVLNIEGDDLGVLIGRRGTTISSLQHIVRLMIASRQTDWPFLTVDVCGYKRRRRSALEDLARRVADQARARRRPIALEPMPADERRVVHLALADHPDVYSESEGVATERKVVIYPKRP
jgi:spoIIIJ-associated protein